MTIFLSISVLLLISVAGVYIYSQIPNTVSFLDEPLSKKQYIPTTSLGNFKIDSLIPNQPDKRILFQSLLIESDFFTKTVVYTVVFNAENNIELTHNLPLTESEQEHMIPVGMISQEIIPSKQVPDNNRTPSGTKLSVYQPSKNLIINLATGSSTSFYHEIDKDGYVTSITIFDKTNNLLYYSRKRWYAFQ